MIGRTEACGQVGSDSLDCWVQLTLPQVALWLRVDCFDFTGKLVFAVCRAIEFKDTAMLFRYKSRSKLRTRPCRFPKSKDTAMRTRQCRFPKSKDTAVPFP
jgi:hypothetical protein